MTCSAVRLAFGLSTLVAVVLAPPSAARADADASLVTHLEANAKSSGDYKALAHYYEVRAAEAKQEADHERALAKSSTGKGKELATERAKLYDQLSVQYEEHAQFAIIQGESAVGEGD